MNNWVIITVTFSTNTADSEFTITNYINGTISGSASTNSYTNVFKDVYDRYTFYIGSFMDVGTLTSFRGNIWSVEMYEYVWNDYTRYIKYN